MKEVTEMPAKPTKGTAQLATQLDAETLQKFRTYADDRGETIRKALERAMTREMTYPPEPEPIDPFPDSPVAKKKSDRK
jgi:hypothetical protein